MWRFIGIRRKKGLSSSKIRVSFWRVAVKLHMGKIFFKASFFGACVAAAALCPLPSAAELSLRSAAEPAKAEAASQKPPAAPAKAPVPQNPASKNSPGRAGGVAAKQSAPLKAAGQTKGRERESSKEGAGKKRQEAAGQGGKKQHARRDGKGADSKAAAAPVREPTRSKRKPPEIKFAAANPYEDGETNLSASKNVVDASLAEHFKSLGLKPAKRCSDAVFIRRATLDLTGRIPDARRLEAFLDDESPCKREKLVDELLASEEFVNYMSLRLGDVLRIKAEFPINLWPNAAQAYTRFVRKSLADGLGWDEMARRMLSSSGSNFRVGEVNFLRAMQSRTPESAASCAALTFMCARYDKIPEPRRGALALFFSRVGYKPTKEWKEEIVFDDPSKRAPFASVFPDGTAASFPAGVSPRAGFAEWLAKRGNPYFARAFANRVWTWIFGSPIVSPVDDMFFSGNRPVSPRLLDALAESFERSGFDIRGLVRTIALSEAYSQSFIPDPSNSPEAALKNFAVYPVRRLDAEILIDTVCSITGTSEAYSSTTPEPYTAMPDGSAAADLPDGSVTTPFLELFGKSPRDTGYADERVNAPSASQKLHMLNSSQVLRKISSSKFSRRFFALPYRKGVYRLYTSILSRRPTSAELKKFEQYRPEGGKFRQWEAMIDTMWALFNSDEFSNRH